MLKIVSEDGKKSRNELTNLWIKIWRQISGKNTTVKSFQNNELSYLVVDLLVLV
jgi:hypothetical protein